MTVVAAPALVPAFNPTWHTRPALIMLGTVGLLAALAFAIGRVPQFRHPGAALLLGGGLSNLLDYARHGAIINIIEINSLQLNLADIFVVSGALWLLTERKT